MYIQRRGSVCLKHHDNYPSLLGNTDNSASGARTSVTGLERLLVSSLAEIVGAGVDDDGALGQSQSRGVLQEEGNGNKDITRTPMTLSGPMSLMNLSWTDPLELP